MDLRDDIPTNLADLAHQLHQIARLEYSAALYEEMKQRLDDLATYLDTFIIPRVPPPTRYLVLENFESPLAIVRQEPELISQVAGANGDHALRPATDPQENIFDDARLSDSR